ncbi:putative 28S ribosomal protein S25, mitochondrial, partial [Fragariocoptes setiger]
MFMFGPAPLRRTLKYLNEGRLHVRDEVRVMEVHYHLHGKKYITPEEQRNDRFNGLRQFYFWDVPRIQYKNPQLQIVRFLDKMPTPYIRCWLDDGSDILFDCFHQSREEINERLHKVIGKSDERLKLEQSVKSEVEAKDNPAIFGYGRERFCMCEVLGQHPCPGIFKEPPGISSPSEKFFT